MTNQILEEFFKLNFFTHAAVGSKSFDKKELGPFYINTKIGQLFDLASLTKILVTTFSYMHYWQFSKKNDQHFFAVPLSQKTPFFQHSSKKGINLEQLFRHTSGYDQWLPLYLVNDLNSQGLAKYLDDKELGYNPGSERKYSDLGFLWLEELFPYLTEGKQLYSYWCEHFVRPLKLTRLLYLPLRHFNKEELIPSSFGNEFEKKMIEEENFGYKVNLPYKHFTLWRNYLLQGEVNDGNGYYLKNGVAPHCGLFGSLSETMLLAEQLWNPSFFNSETLDYVLREDSFGGGIGFARSDRILQLGLDSSEWCGHHGFTGCTIAWNLKKKSTFVFLSNRLIHGFNDAGQYPDWKKVGKKIISIM